MLRCCRALAARRLQTDLRRSSLAFVPALEGLEQTVVAAAWEAILV